jgi:hypothetical protein
VRVNSGTLLALLLVPCVAGCGDSAAPGAGTIESPSGYPFASAASDCAPWDGPAVTVLFTTIPMGNPTPSPFVRVSVYRDINSVPGGSYNWTEGDQTATALRCSSSARCERATNGRIAFQRLSAQSLTGNTDLLFADGTRFRGAFRASLNPRPIACG